MTDTFGGILFAKAKSAPMTKSPLTTKRRLITMLALIVSLYPWSAAAIAADASKGSVSTSLDGLRGHVLETGGKPRITRPPTPSLQPLQANVQEDVASGQAGKATLDDTSFQIVARQDGSLKGALDLSHWNPWAGQTISRRTGGYASMLQPGGYLLTPRYQSPLLHGNVHDLEAVEHAWRPSARTAEVGGRTAMVRVTLAICRPGNPEQAAAWEQLMGELKNDANSGNNWRQWQERVADDVISQATVWGQLPGSGWMHIRITGSGVQISPARGALTNVQSPREAIAQLVRVMNSSGRLALPSQTNVTEVHLMIVVHSSSPYVNAYGD